MSKKKDFVSNVTGEEWYKHNSVRWDKVINQVGVILEDEVHVGKFNIPVTLKKGSRVLIDDIRGRIKPQYRVKDIKGKIWFVSALNVEVLYNQKREFNPTDHHYRGGVREEETNLPGLRYSLDNTTDDEIKESRNK